MQEVEQTPGLQRGAATGTKLPVSVIIPVRNEAKNLPRCLRTLGEAGEVVVVDSQSTDATVEIAREFGAQVVHFHYQCSEWNAAAGVQKAATQFVPGT